MVNINIAQPVKLKPTSLSKLSAFVSFDYDAELVSTVKELGTRVYLPDKKCWEIPESAVPMLMQKLKKYDVTLTGTMTRDHITKVHLPNGFNFKTTPYRHQVEGVMYGLENEAFLLGDDQGLGKALSLDTRIYTPTGYKLMRDIEVGDLVFNRRGQPVRVTATYNHHDVEMYEFTFSDGKKIRCCKDHLWKIYDQGISRVVDTNWFLQPNHLGIIRKDALRNSTNYNYRIDRCEPVKFNSQEIPLDPYVLGVLLGDGSMVSSLTLTTADQFIVDEVNLRLPGSVKAYQPPCLEGTIEYYIGTPGESSGTPNAVKRSLVKLGLWGRNSHMKFIPELYKYNSVEVRLQILQGLLDTDGYASKDNLVQYTTVSKQLCEDVEFLVESLGGLAIVSEYEGAYTITIRVDEPQNLFLLPRKVARLRSRKFRPNRHIVSIERVDNADAKCITVDDSESLFLAEHFIVTHNTKQIIDIALCRKISEGIKHCLIICGINGTKYNWADEIKIHSSEDSWILGTRYTKRTPVKMIEGGTKEKLEDLQNIPSQFFWITNIETLRGGAYKEGKAKNAKYRFPIAERIQELIDDGAIGMIAFDEAHKAKNPDSQQGRALLSIKAKHPIPMSGTFVLNNPLDLYLPLCWAGFEDHSFYQYKNHYCVMGGFNNKEVVGYKNLDELRTIMSKVMLRRTKGDVLDLPPKVHSIEYVDLTSEQKKLYKEVKDQIVDSIDKIRINPDPLSEMLRLRQVTGAPEILSSSITQSAKLDRLLEMVEEITSVGEKAIIFSQWSTMTDIIRGKLKVYNPAYITGEVKSEVRMEEVKKFQNDDSCKVIIGTVGAMGTGLTLTAASTVIFVDEPWNRGLKDQAEDRAHRIGTRGTVRVVTLIAKDTIDEGIYNLVQKKGKMSDFLIDGKVDNRNVDATLEYLLSFGD